MFCSNCGYHLSKDKVSKFEGSDPNRTKDTIETFVCPRCGKLIKENLTENDVKDLARASHSEIHRARNKINAGLCTLTIGIILLCIAIAFLLLSFKQANGGEFEPQCVEFYVFCGLISLTAVSFGFSAYSLTTGIIKQKNYKHLLKDIQNGTFVQ